MARATRTNRTTAYQREKSIDFSTSSADPLASWRISGIKGQVFEHWYFDSVSDDSKSGIVFTLARDASYALLGQGHLRVEIDVTFADGTHFNHVDWMSDSVIEDGGEEVRGVWSAPGKSYAHTIAADGSSARVDVDAKDLKGYFTLSSLSPPVYPGGETHGEVQATSRLAETEIQPKIHLVQVIPTGNFEANLSFRGRKLKFRGIGGHMHVWAAGSWFDTTCGWRVCRAAAGPWSVTCMEYTGLDGAIYSSGYVAKNGKKKFGALEVYNRPQSSMKESNDGTNGIVKRSDTRVRWLPTYNTGLAGRFNDTSTGCILQYSTGVPGEEYRFELKHRRRAFDVLFGSGECGLTSFLGDASGGKVGEEVYKGVQFTNVCVLPRKSDALLLISFLG
jgi:hypothetical protein